MHPAFASAPSTASLSPQRKAIDSPQSDESCLGTGITRTSSPAALRAFSACMTLWMLWKMRTASRVTAAPSLPHHRGCCAPRLPRAVGSAFGPCLRVLR